MKKVFSILFASIILVSGMHLSIAEHICGGKVAAVKWSFSGDKASCGMEKAEGTCNSQNVNTSNCCKNKIAYFSVDNNYSPSTFQVKDVIKKISQVFAIPVSMLPHLTIVSHSSFANISPPDKSIGNAVSLSEICVFRI